MTSPPRDSLESGGKASRETAYYPLSAPLSPERLNEVVRALGRGKPATLEARRRHEGGSGQKPPGKRLAQSRRPPPHGAEGHAKRHGKGLATRKNQKSGLGRSLSRQIAHPVLKCDCPAPRPHGLRPRGLVKNSKWEDNLIWTGGHPANCGLNVTTAHVSVKLEVSMQDIVVVLPLLCCVSCRHPSLVISADVDPNWGDLGSRSLVCEACNERYPLTADGIPVMWSPAVKSWMLEKRAEDATLASNIAVYDEFSSDYLANDRQGDIYSNQVYVCVDRLLSDSRKSASARLHLDFGCGPGHVIGWLSKLGLRSVGLDVSLANLRNTIKQTGALAVLGDIQRAPFRDDVFDLVTEASVLHHILDWRAAISESCRVCNGEIGIVFNNEPSYEQLDWGVIAQTVFNSRFYAYNLASYVLASKHKFHNIDFAKENYWSAEIHNQPGKGFHIKEMLREFETSHYAASIIRHRNFGPTWQGIVLHGLSGHNPWDEKYRPFGVIATRTVQP